MEAKHLIMGTAGHIDHGKTSLIKALTGFDCDTHKQEKERGITINLGFSHLNLPGGSSVGIVDVPGHADFIKTMIAGACGIDFVLFIIAADEGIMPQTFEHLEIMKLLEIQHGIIVLTKIDLVDAELVELAEEEIRDFVAGSFLENAPRLGISSKSGRGLPELIKAISLLVENIPNRTAEGLFRLYIDRIFSQEGFGTIVNGSVLSGSIRKNDPVYLLPGNRELRIRRLEHHGQEADSVSAGDRASFNLVGFKQKEFRRGMILADRFIESTKLIDVRLTLFQAEAVLELWSQVIFLLGTNRLMCRLHLLDRNRINSGESCLAQIYLPAEIVCQIGDKFIIRNSSGTLTLGGGKVIDPYPLHHRRRREAQVDIVKKLAGGELHEIVAAEVRKTNLPLSHQEIANRLHLEANDLIEVIFSQLPADIVFFQDKQNILLLMKKIAVSTQNRILSNLLEYHQKNPLKEKGRTLKELLGIFGSEQNEDIKLLIKLILQKLVDEGKIRQKDKSWSHASHQVEMDPVTEKLIEEVDYYLKSIGHLSADFAEIEAHISEKVPQKKLQQVLAFLQDEKKIYFSQMRYLHGEFFEHARQMIIDYLLRQEAGITVAEFRDMLSSNRTTALLILDIMDNEGITLRKGNNRFLTRKFLESRNEKQS